MTDAPEIPTLDDAQVVYLGERVSADGKAHALFVAASAIDNAHEPGPAHAADLLEKVAGWFNPKGFVRPVVGGIYRGRAAIQQDTVQRLGVASLKFQGRMAQADTVARLELRHRAVQIEADARKQADKLRKEPAVLQELAAVRALYQRTGYRQRAALEIAVMDIIRGGRGI